MNEITYDEHGYPTETLNGVRCGNCSSRSRKVRHGSAGAVRTCYEIHRSDQAQQLAELAAEQAIERYFEDRGWAEAQAQRDWEDRNGVVQFDEAYRMACPGLFDY